MSQTHADTRIPPEMAHIPREKHVEMYRAMLLVRRFEEMAGKMYMQANIGGFCHLYIGQEAVGVGVISTLRPDDYVMGTYREHGQALAAGCDPKAVMAELFGRSTGVSGGRGGSMHLFDRSHNFMGGDGIVAGGLPLAAGVGLAIRYRGGDQVCVCFFGDGAVNEGAFHEALNLAGLWHLPVVFVCENNLYGMGTYVGRASAVPDLSLRASACGMQSVQVDGMDILAVRRAADAVVKECRQGDGPWFVEARTYRFRGHSMADPATYRTKDEVEAWRVRDPIGIYQHRLQQAGLLTDGDVQSISAEIDALVEQCVQYANASPAPPPQSLHHNVYRAEV